MCNVVTTYYHICALISTGIVSVLPLFQESRVLPLRCWYPFDQTISPYYELLYASQILVQIVMPLSFCVAMVLPMGMAFLLCGQYDILFCSLRNVPWTAMRYLSPGRAVVYGMRVVQRDIIAGLLGESFRYARELKDDIAIDEAMRRCPKKQAGPREGYNSEMQDQVHEALCDCVRFHQMINVCCVRMEAVNNPVALVKILEISFQMCVLALAILKSSQSLLNNMTNVLYLALTVSDLFCLCYLGQIIESQSARVPDFLYDLPWDGFSAPCRRTILIMMLNSLKPKLMTGGKFFALSYEKFVSVSTVSF